MANLRRANGRDKPWKVHYIAVGNEAWGCGGSMRPEFYADNFRRFNTFIKNYQGKENKIYRVACGPSDADYDWTETLMKIALRRDRPDLWPALVTEKTFSFPSGHATMTTLFFGGAAAVVFHVTKKRGVRIAAVTAAGAIILAVAFSRVYLGAHWLTDVVAGILLGLFWVVLCATGTEYFARRSPARSASRAQ